MVLEDLYGISTGIDLELLTDTARIVDECSGVPLPLTQPVIGRYAFMGDGAYWAAEAHLANEERVHARFPFAPDIVGARERIVWSDRTATPESIAAKLQTLGLATDDGTTTTILDKLRAILETKPDYPAWLDDDEFAGVAQQVSAKEE